MEGMNTLASAAAVVLSPNPLSCAHCPRTFQTAEERNEHAKLHTGLTPFPLTGQRTPDFQKFLNACASALNAYGTSATAELLHKSPFEESFMRDMQKQPAAPQLLQQHAALVPQDPSGATPGFAFTLRRPPSLTIPSASPGGQSVPSSAAVMTPGARQQLKTQLTSKRKASIEGSANGRDASNPDSSMSSDETTPKGRKRVRTDPNLSTDSKARARELNREAAAKCRQRKKQVFEELKAKAERLEATNEAMASEMAQMREELTALRSFAVEIFGMAQQQQQAPRDGADAQQ